MSRIALLSEEVACQVAAGEVVERPASVVKELVENALDAQARHVEVLVRKGGISLIRVADDGIGMDRDDALLCLERHATSKIRKGSDLAAIHTLGFRGEALPSIASVSRMRLCTRLHDAEAGTEVAITGGRIDHVRDSGEAPGTQIEVRSLFFNLPARRKFLRTENTEMSHVEHQLQLQALGHPEVGFLLKTDTRLVFHLPPTKTLRERIHDLFGASLADELLEVPALPPGPIRVRGFIGRAGISRSTRAQQHLFVNGRPVENATLSHGLREGYHTALMKGQHPVTFLFIDLPPDQVDVNVHPAKREVRFRDPGRLRDIVAQAVRETLETDRERWSQHFSAPDTETSPGLAVISPSQREDEPAAPVRDTGESQGEALPLPFLSSLLSPPPLPTASAEPVPSLPNISPVCPLAPAPPPSVAEEEALHPSFTSQPPVSVSQFAIPGEQRTEGKSFRLLGVIGNLYVVMENASGMVLVDQHAAHERILFEELRRRMEETGVLCQRLLMPVTLHLGPRDSDWVAQNTETLQKMGIGIEPFGEGAWKLDTLPQFVQQKDPHQLVREIIDELRTVSSQTSKLRLGEDVIAKTVCRAAVKANDVLRGPELVRLIEDLLLCELPYCCPHGRPTMIQLSYAELEKKFGRRT